MPNLSFSFARFDDAAPRGDFETADLAYEAGRKAGIKPKDLNVYERLDKRLRLAVSDRQSADLRANVQ